MLVNGFRVEPGDGAVDSNDPTLRGGEGGGGRGRPGEAGGGGGND